LKVSWARYIAENFYLILSSACAKGKVFAAESFEDKINDRYLPEEGWRRLRP
jgi:hypothetical protein